MPLLGLPGAFSSIPGALGGIPGALGGHGLRREWAYLGNSGIPTALGRIPTLFLGANRAWDAANEVLTGEAACFKGVLSATVGAAAYT